MSSDTLSKLIDEHVICFLRHTMGGQACTAQFICDFLYNSIDDVHWKNVPDGQHIFYIKESLMRLLRNAEIKETSKMTKGAYLDDISAVKKKKEIAYSINYKKVLEQYQNHI